MLICLGTLILIFLVTILRTEIRYKTLKGYPKNPHRVKYIMHKFFLVKGLQNFYSCRKKQRTLCEAAARKCFLSANLTRIFNQPRQGQQQYRSGVFFRPCRGPIPIIQSRARKQADTERWSIEPFWNRSLTARRPKGSGPQGGRGS